MKSMKLVSSLIVLAAMILFTPLDSSAEFYDGNKLVQDMREHEKAERSDPSANHLHGAFYMGYVAGVYDALSSSFSPPENVTIDQLCSIVAKYLKENPQKWTLPASVLIWGALQKAFPKR
jgi:thymidylate synthase